jgi:SAM-dependent methyltransferase
VALPATSPWHPPALEPDPFEDTFTRMLAARAIVTATSLGVFDALAEEPAGSEELAARLELNETGMEVLLGALRSLGYLEPVDGRRLGPTPAAERLLTRRSPESVATFVGPLNAYHWEVMAELDAVLRLGASTAWHERPADDAVWPAYVRGLFEISRGEHDANAALVPLAKPRRLLDLGGAHGGFAIAMCRRHPALRATVLDLPASAAAGRAVVAEERLSGRIDFREGDALRAELGAGLDVVSAFNLVHHLAPEECLTLFRRVAAALRRSGWFVVGDTERPKPTEPVHQLGALSGLLFYAMSGTRTYSRAEVTGWLEEAGFSTIRFLRNEVSPWRVLYLACLRDGARTR